MTHPLDEDDTFINAALACMDGRESDEGTLDGLPDDSMDIIMLNKTFENESLRNNNSKPYKSVTLSDEETTMTMSDDAFVFKTSPDQTQTEYENDAYPDHGVPFHDEEEEMDESERVMHYYLKNVFNLDEFRANQKEIIQGCLEKKDIFVLMPTGGGKSLCYQLPALMDSGTTIIISPLLSLIRDQMRSLLARGILSLALNSTITKADRELIIKCLRSGLVKIFYITPELIVQSTFFQQLLTDLHAEGRLSRFVIDECHCIMQWMDFRPDYLQLKWIRNNFDTPIMALTATATPKIITAIQDELNISCDVYKTSFNRNNLKLKIKLRTDKTYNEIVSFIECYYPNSSGIIYCLSKRECEMLSEKLNTLNIKTAFYHAGLNKAERNSIQEKWSRNQILIIVATIAFGMGIDKKEVRFVIHFSMPKSIEGYYQEIGRAGRDGLESICIMYYSPSDKQRIEWLIRKSGGKLDELEKIIEFCVSRECRRVFLMRHFGESFTKEQCRNTCDNCDGVETDCTAIVRELVECVDDLVAMACDKCGESAKGPCKHNFPGVPIGVILSTYRGAKTKRLQKFAKCRNFGKGTAVAKDFVDAILREMVLKKTLEERRVKKGPYSWVYLRVKNRHVEHFSTSFAR